jgi:hypothetical protein
MSVRSEPGLDAIISSRYSSEIARQSAEEGRGGAAARIALWDADGAHGVTRPTTHTADGAHGVTRPTIPARALPILVGRAVRCAPRGRRTPRPVNYPHLFPARILFPEGRLTQPPEEWPVDSFLSLLPLFVFRRRGWHAQKCVWPSSAPPKNKKRMGVLAWWLSTGHPSGGLRQFEVSSLVHSSNSQFLNS